ncbi:phosphate ABC transporter substrate-binding protein [Vibrio sp. CAIM 722]|uniref:Phosphate ABC transporter substrate-binding protein n=1 Tax=Vibrio eleionomae TaxID=2653505 RepID=A0A7X4LKH9_9VIBR|nr:phosphate ABC transporter substrate-binding protein [Vibrio eleionomae]MZI93312.1 phosphate ABC transporter substrate-binding protein [Vibrio eleionomae]
MLKFIIACCLVLVSAPSIATANEINVSGSTSVARLMDVLAEHFNKQHPSTFIAVHGVDSTAGIQLLKMGVSQLAMSSRYLTESEQDAGLTVYTLALDGIAVVVNIENPIKDIKKDDLYRIYQGEITNWKELGGQDKQIALVTREVASGTRYSFETLLGLTKIINEHMVSTIDNRALVVNSNGMVKTLVSHNPQAIGFISTGSIDDSIQPISINGEQPTPIAIAANQYPLARPFLILHYPNKDTVATNEFLQYLSSSDAQKTIAQYGYIPAPKQE